MRPRDKTPTRITYGIVVNRDPLILAHKDEMILPAELSAGLKALIEATPADKRFRYEP